MLSEGVGIFEEMLRYDHTRRMLEKQFAIESAKKIIDPAQALLQILQTNMNLLFERMSLREALYGEEGAGGEEKEQKISSTPRRFGATRIRLLEFLERLLEHFLSEHVASEPCAQFLEALRKHNFWPLLLVISTSLSFPPSWLTIRNYQEALTVLPLNNLLHITIMRIIEVVLDSSEQKVRIEVTLSPSLQPACELTIYGVYQLLTEEKLLDKIIAADARNKETFVLSRIMYNTTH